MKKFKRFFTVMLCLAVMLTALTACGGQKPEAVTEPPETQPPQEPSIPTDDESQATTDGSRTIITLGTYGASLDFSLIDEFNQSQDEYALEIRDYRDEFPDEPNRALREMITEIMSGEGPDIIDLFGWDADLKKYAEKGVFEDLYPWLDADEELSRDDFIESILSLCEVDGGLYATRAGFDVTTMGCAKSVADELSGWTLEDFYPYSKLINSAYGFMDPADVAENGYPNTVWDGRGLLSELCATTLTSFVDYAAGEAKFDSPEFIELLECCKEMQNAEPTDNPKLHIADTDGFYVTQVWEHEFGEEFEYVGFPGLGGRKAGSYVGGGFSFFAMNAMSANKEGAWKFMRSALTEEYQRTSYVYQLAYPTNKAAFNAKLEESQKQVIFPNINTYYYHPTTDEEVEKVLDMIDSLVGMRSYSYTIGEIVMPASRAYFEGTATAEETAQLIQDRMTQYLSEQG